MKRSVFIFCGFFIFFISRDLFATEISRDLSADLPHQLQQISKTTEWLRLLHASDEGVSKIQGAHFFLSPHGARDPLAELQATFYGMITEDSAAATFRCRFPARREFLLRQFPEYRSLLKACPEREDWIRRLNPKSLSWVFASGYLSSAASSFGHTFLVIHRQDSSSPLLDYAVNYSARTGSENGALFALKGLLGFYPGQFALLPYHQMIKDYQNLEGRDLFEFPLDFDENEVRYLLYHLMELEQGWIDYYFIDQNCSSLLTEVLAVVRPQQIHFEWNPSFTIPIETIKQNQTVIKSVIKTPSLLTQFHERWDLLNESEKQMAKWLMSQIRDEQPLPSLDEIKVFASKLESFRKLSGENGNLNLVETFEVLQLWFSTREPEKADSQRKNIFALNQMRSRLGANSKINSLSSDMITENPLEVHDPRQIRFGFRSGSESGSSADSKTSFTGYSFAVRPAYHDLTSPERGMPLGSEVKILEFEFLLKDQKGKKTFDIDNVTLISLLNPLPIEPFDKPLSWGFSVGYDTIGADGRQWIAQGKLGYSKQFLGRKSLLSGLLRTQFGSSSSAEGAFRLGPEVMYTFNFKRQHSLVATLYSGVSVLDARESIQNQMILSYGYDLRSNQSLHLNITSESFAHINDFSKFEKNWFSDSMGIQWEIFF